MYSVYYAWTVYAATSQNIPHLECILLVIVN